MDKIKTILSGIAGLEERTKNSDCSTEFRNGQNRVYALVKELIYQQFPELQESDDERIRKWIVNYIRHRVFNEEEHPMALKAIEWLEKQKEQKPALRLVGDGLISDPNAHFELVGEQKPAEWSEEDEKHREWINEFLLDGERKIPEFAEEYQAARNWFNNKLKSIRPSWKPSEEQMEALKKVTGNAVDADEYYPALATLYYDLKEQF